MSCFLHPVVSAVPTGDVRCNTTKKGQGRGPNFSRRALKLLELRNIVKEYCEKLRSKNSQKRIFDPLALIQKGLENTFLGTFYFYRKTLTPPPLLTR